MASALPQPRRVPDALIRKISVLSAERLSELEAFVDTLGRRAASRSLLNQSMTAAEPAFAAVWSNPDDDVYDAI